MPWTKPDFQEISLNMEVTGYVNTDGEVLRTAESPTRPEAASCADAPHESLAISGS